MFLGLISLLDQRTFSLYYWAGNPNLPWLNYSKSWVNWFVCFKKNLNVQIMCKLILLSYWKVSISRELLKIKGKGKTRFNRFVFRDTKHFFSTNTESRRNILLYLILFYSLPNSHQISVQSVSFITYLLVDLGESDFTELSAEQELKRDYKK